MHYIFLGTAYSMHFFILIKNFFTLNSVSFYTPFGETSVKKKLVFMYNGGGRVKNKSLPLKLFYQRALLICYA